MLCNVVCVCPYVRYIVSFMYCLCIAMSCTNTTSDTPTNPQATCINWYKPCGPGGMESEKLVIDDVIATVIGGGVPLLPTVVAVNTSWFVAVDPPEACDDDHYNQ